MATIGKYFVKGRFLGNFTTKQQKVLTSGDPFPKGDEHKVMIYRGIINQTEEISVINFDEAKGFYNFKEVNNIQINTSEKWPIKNDRIFSLYDMKLTNVEVFNVSEINGKTSGELKGDIIASVAEHPFNDVNQEAPYNPGKAAEPFPTGDKGGDDPGGSDIGTDTPNPGGGDTGGETTGGGNGITDRIDQFRKGCNTKWLRWLLYLLLILLLLYLLAKCMQVGQKLTCKYDEYKYRTEWKKIKEKNDSLKTKIDSLKTDNEGYFVDADFLIVTYYFDSISGLDLDTRTRLINPSYSDTLGYGYCENNSKASSGFLSWAGDNVQYGAESCFIDLSKFSKNDIIQLECSALWWQKRYNGDIRLDIRAFKGGIVNQEERKFVNYGGIQKGLYKYPDNIKKIQNLEPINKKEQGQYIGTIIYNKEINYLSLDKY